MSGKGSGRAHCTPTSTASPLLRHRIELGTGSVADDELAAPLACVSELRYPETRSRRRRATLLALAGGGCLSTWQGDSAL